MKSAIVLHGGKIFLSEQPCMANVNMEVWLVLLELLTYLQELHSYLEQVQWAQREKEGEKHMLQKFPPGTSAQYGTSL